MPAGVATVHKYGTIRTWSDDYRMMLLKEYGGLSSEQYLHILKYDEHVPASVF